MNELPNGQMLEWMREAVKATLVYELMSQM